jgi:hypothetical protein
MKHCAGEASIHPGITKMHTSGSRNESRRGIEARIAI